MNEVYIPAYLGDVMHSGFIVEFMVYFTRFMSRYLLILSYICGTYLCYVILAKHVKKLESSQAFIFLTILGKSVC